MSDMTTKEILEEARSLITEERNWTQGALAKDRAGSEVSLNSDDACSFCASGAIQIVAAYSNRWSKAFDAFRDAASGSWIVPFNDTHTHAEVIAVFDAAIAAEIDRLQRKERKSDE